MKFIWRSSFLACHLLRSTRERGRHEDVEHCNIRFGRGTDRHSAARFGRRIEEGRSKGNEGGGRKRHQDERDASADAEGSKDLDGEGQRDRAEEGTRNDQEFRAGARAREAHLLIRHLDEKGRHRSQRRRYERLDRRRPARNGGERSSGEKAGSEREETLTGYQRKLSAFLSFRAERGIWRSGRREK